jgi:hypothetical protein
LPATNQLTFTVANTMYWLLFVVLLSLLPLLLHRLVSVPLLISFRILPLPHFLHVSFVRLLPTLCFIWTPTLSVLEYCPPPVAFVFLPLLPLLSVQRCFQPSERIAGRVLQVQLLHLQCKVAANEWKGGARCRQRLRVGDSTGVVCVAATCVNMQPKASNPLLASAFEPSVFLIK